MPLSLMKPLRMVSSCSLEMIGSVSSRIPRTGEMRFLMNGSRLSLATKYARFEITESRVVNGASQSLSTRMKR